MLDPGEARRRRSSGSSSQSWLQRVEIVAQIARGRSPEAAAPRQSPSKPGSGRAPARASPPSRPARCRAPAAAGRSRPGRPRYGRHKSVAMPVLAPSRRPSADSAPRAPAPRYRIWASCPCQVSTWAFSPAFLAQRATLRASPARCLAQAMIDGQHHRRGAACALAPKRASRCIRARESPPPDTATAPGQPCMRRHRRGESSPRAYLLQAALRTARGLA